MAETITPNFVYLQAMQSAGTTVQAEQSDILHKYGAAVDNDVAATIPENGKDAFIPFLESIPGVHVDENTKAIALDAPRHIVISSLALRADLAYNNEQQWIDAGIDFGAKPGVRFSRVVNGEGLEVELRFDEQSIFSGAKIAKTENWDRQGRSMKGEIVLDNNGNITSSSGDLKDFSEGHVPLTQLLSNITNPQGLDTKIDFKTIIPLF